MVNWRPLPATPLWWINTQNSNALWLFFFLVHIVAWVLIYAATLTMDFAELTGLKQVRCFCSREKMFFLGRARRSRDGLMESRLRRRCHRAGPPPVLVCLFGSRVNGTRKVLLGLDSCKALQKKQRTKNKEQRGDCTARKQKTVRGPPDGCRQTLTLL